MTEVFISLIVGLCLAGLGLFFKTAMWVNNVRTNHLPHLQTGIDDLKQGQKEQTAALERIMDRQTDQLKSMNASLVVIAAKK